MKKLIFTFFGLLVFLSPPTQAGVFNIPQFVEYRSWAVGVEPELTLSSFGISEDSGVGVTAKFTYGFTPLSNLQVGIGTGSGARGFRVGGTYTFDFIPDMEGQIGAGVAIQGYYYKLAGGFSQTETTLYPYLHKMFTSNEGLNYDPYFAMPFGMAFFNGSYRTIWQLVFGSYFKTSEHFGLNGEIGLNLKDTDTYISAGITYRD